MTDASDQGAARADNPRDSADILDSVWDNVEEVVAGSLLFKSLNEEGRRELVGRGVVMVFPAGYVVPVSYTHLTLPTICSV